MTVNELIELLRGLPQEAIVVAHSADADIDEVGPCAVTLFTAGRHDLLPHFCNCTIQDNVDYVFINGWPHL
jgi:hypothetical protein